MVPQGRAPACADLARIPRETVAQSCSKTWYPTVNAWNPGPVEVVYQIIYNWVWQIQGGAGFQTVTVCQRVVELFTVVYNFAVLQGLLVDLYVLLCSMLLSLFQIHISCQTHWQMKVSTLPWDADGSDSFLRDFHVFSLWVQFLGRGPRLAHPNKLKIRQCFKGTVDTW